MSNRPEGAFALPRSGRPRKYYPGEPIRSLDELDEAMERGDMLWYSGRPTHSSFVGNLNYGTMRHRIRSGSIRRAEFRDEYITWLRKELAVATTERGTTDE